MILPAVPAIFKFGSHLKKLHNGTAMRAEDFHAYFSTAPTRIKCQPPSARAIRDDARLTFHVIRHGS